MSRNVYPLFCLYLRVLFFKRSLSPKFNLNENIPARNIGESPQCRQRTADG